MESERKRTVEEQEGRDSDIKRRVKWCLVKRLLVVALLGIAAGCSGGRSGAVEPAPDVRPPIERALDVSAYSSVDTVCGLVPAGVLEALGLRVSSSGAVVPENPTCSLEGRGEAQVQVFSRTDRLAYAYGLDRGALPRFVEPLVIGGQPAARVQVTETAIENWCVVVVGLSDSAGVEVTSMRSEACGTADRLAEAVVDRLG
ncbi:DUF3558 family protein [Actinokineospora sp. NPDC004072]